LDTIGNAKLESFEGPVEQTLGEQARNYDEMAAQIERTFGPAARRFS